MMTKILLALSWGHQFPKPGLSNEIMALEITKIKDNFDVIIVQYEIGEALKSYRLTPDYVIGQAGVYINTYEVIKAMVHWAKNKDLDLSKSDIAVMCHTTHWRGCRMVCRKFNISAHRIPVDIPHDPNSHQWYTRGPLQAFIGKILHGVEYFFRGEIEI